MGLVVGGKKTVKTQAKGLANLVSKAVGSTVKTVVKTVQAIAPTKAKVDNTVQTLKAAVTGKGVVATTGNKAVDKVLASAASNPFTTALGGATVAAPKVAVTALKAGVSALPTSAKVAGVVAAPAVASFVIANPKAVSSAAKAPAALASFGGNVGTFAANPSVDNAKQIFKDNPVISSAVVGAAAIAVGAGTATVLSNAINTQATRANTEALNNPPIPTGAGAVLSPITSSSNTPVGSPVPITPATQVLGKPASTGVAKRRKAKKIRAPPATNIRVNVLTANQSSLRSSNYRYY